VLLEEHLPELLIAEAALLPPASGFEPSGYPLVIRLRLTVDGQRADIDGIFEEFRHELQRVWQELYSRKACEMSALLDHYLAGLNSFSYLPSLTVYQNGECIELPAMEIQVVEASGNYVRIYAADKVYSIREAISSLNAKLDPDIFLRTHRSYIVNLQCVSRVIPRNGGPPALLLKNGRTVPIGPSYRSAVRRLFETDEELIA
jgi:DNA-binding LytR/AlgR family response regulator